MEAFGLWEGTVLLWIQENLRGFLDPLVSFYTRLGDSGLVWILLCLALLLHPKTRKAGVAGVVGLLMSLLFTNILLKPLVERTRPWLVIEGLLPLVTERDPNSFPSGHTSAAFSCAAAWLATLPKTWCKALALTAALLMALSRLYVGVHFPSDVLCGTLVGIFCGWCACKLLKLWEEKRRLQKGCFH